MTTAEAVAEAIRADAAAEKAEIEQRKIFFKAGQAFKAALAGNRDGAVEKAILDAEQVKYQELRDARAKAGVALSQAKEKLRLEQVGRDTQRKRDIESEAEILAYKIRDNLTSAESTSKRLRSLLHEYSGLANDKGIDVMFTPWLTIATELEKANKLPAKVFGTPLKLKQETGGWIARIKEYAR